MGVFHSADDTEGAGNAAAYSGDLGLAGSQDASHFAYLASPSLEASRWPDLYRPDGHSTQGREAFGPSERALHPFYRRGS